MIRLPDPVQEQPPAALELGAAEFAPLVRLRAIALILRAASAAWPELGRVDIALVEYGGLLRFVNLGNPTVRLLVGRAAGWPDDLTGTDTPGLFAAVVDAEFPAGFPPGLLALAAHFRSHHSLPTDAISFLARAKWQIHFSRILPCLPAQVSAHEALEALLGADAVGGVGSGPLGLLARQAMGLLGGTRG